MMNRKHLFLKSSLFAIALAALVTSCNNRGNKEQNSSTDSTAVDTLTSAYDTVVGQDSVRLYTLSNGSAVAKITNYGARVVSLSVPDKDGNAVDVVLGYKDIATYQKAGDGFYGAIVGRFGNRIAKGQFSLDGEKYQLELNDGKNSLHGGENGFFSKVWRVKSSTENSLTLEYLSPDGDAGYPET